MNQQLMDMISNNRNETMLLVTPNSLKREILKEISNKGLFNISWISLNELINKLTYQLDDNAVMYLMNNFNINFDTANTYIKQILNTLYIDINNCKDKIKYNTIKDIIIYLCENELIEFDEAFFKDLKEKNDYLKNINKVKTNSLFRDNISKKKIIVYGYLNLNKIQEKILKGILKDDDFIPFDNNYSNINYILKCKDIDEEVYHLAENIAGKINENVSINDIKIVGLNDNYYSKCKRIFNLYHIPVNFEEKVMVRYLPITKVILDKINNDQLTSEFIESLNEEELMILDKITNAVNKAYVIKNKVSEKVYYEYIDNLLKETYIRTSESKNKIELLSEEDVITLKDKHVFILNFNQGVFPKINMDEDYYSDKTKIDNSLDSSSLLNETNKLKTLNMLKSNNNLYISYRLKDEGVELIRSSLLNEFNIKEISLENSYSKYSDDYNKYILSIKLDNYNKYRVKDELLLKLNTTYHNGESDYQYGTYDNQFSGLSEEGLKFTRDKLSIDAVRGTKNQELLNTSGNKIKLSYSSIDSYNSCAFKYYVSKVLKIDLFEETFSTFKGSLFHHVLKEMNKVGFDIDQEIDQFVETSRYKLPTKEKLFLENMKEDIKENTKVIQEFDKIIEYKEHVSEGQIEYIETINTDLTLYMYGEIDKISFKQRDNKTYVMVVDYKTYSVDIDLDLIPHGLSLQLLVYYQLIKKALKIFDPVNKKNIDFIDPEIGGFYIQEILPKIEGNNQEEYDKNRIKNLRLKGYTNITYQDRGDIRLMDDRGVVLNINDDVIKNFTVTQKNTFHSNALVIDNKEIDSLMTEVDHQIKKTSENIYYGKFDINPKQYRKFSYKDNTYGDRKNIGCKFCKFKDICYMIPDNYQEIKGGK